MKKMIVAVLLGLAVIASTSVQANDWGNWGGIQKDALKVPEFVGKMVIYLGFEIRSM
ncbi:hypothetical protein [Photobacterium kishitanii]|uniref:hypothetical protein n=1 Tax=Photobacterium kishitanii TaxID=318456 RepID=UPI0027393AE4|nr:hypothetical protein [Photobacterium kishitanii]